eukprot:CAMPEP_0115077602 /NCGR_PEP_ID=MMETSP0227-20121206/17086_1 /TAXON_ID=89957 /ORGANISM="Polarella glacialis, Strain CCMP 1383" /LENGTH=158 /DNA_ID=CAMNT_0002464897 /DNA_START=74 /DNA_END=550 /DNA_ORIENTATION=+
MTRGSKNKIAGEPDSWLPKEESHSEDSEDSRGTSPEDSKNNIAASTEESHSEDSEETLTLGDVPWEAHRLGVCTPCTYFAMKSNGCRNGDACQFCHYCTHEEVKARIRRAKKASTSARFKAAREKLLVSSPPSLESTECVHMSDLLFQKTKTTFSFVL